MVSEDDFGIDLILRYLDSQEAAFNFQVPVHCGLIALFESISVPVSCRSGAELNYASLGILRNVLPVSITADNKHVFLRPNKRSNFVTFRTK